MTLVGELRTETGLGASQSPAIRRLVALGKGHQAQIWVLARLQQNQLDDPSRASPALLDETDRLYALAFAILRDHSLAILAQATAYLRTQWFRWGRPNARR